MLGTLPKGLLHKYPGFLGLVEPLKPCHPRERYPEALILVSIKNRASMEKLTKSFALNNSGNVSFLCKALALFLMARYLTQANQPVQDYRGDKKYLE